MSGSATSGGNVVFVGDLCDSTNRYYCDPSVDSSNMYTGKCVQNTLFFEYYPTYIQFPGMVLCLNFEKGSCVTRTGRSTSVGLATRNAWQSVATATSQGKTALALLIAIHICTATNRTRPAATLCSSAAAAHRTTNATWACVASSIRTSPSLEYAKTTFRCPLTPVRLPISP